MMESIRDSSEQTKSEMKEMKERLGTLTALLEENKDEGQSQKRLSNDIHKFTLTGGVLARSLVKS